MQQNVSGNIAFGVGAEQGIVYTVAYHGKWVVVTHVVIGKMKLDLLQAQFRNFTVFGYVFFVVPVGKAIFERRQVSHKAQYGNHYKQRNTYAFFRLRKR